MEKHFTTNWWVLSFGRDRDGFRCPQVYEFTSEKEAKQYADNSNKWSNGFGYAYTNVISHVVEYCNENRLEWRKYITCL